MAKGEAKGNIVFSFMTTLLSGNSFILSPLLCAILGGKIVVSFISCCVSAPRIVPGMSWALDKHFLQRGLQQTQTHLAGHLGNKESWAQTSLGNTAYSDSLPPGDL